MMRYDAVLFDLDGTIVASAPGICGSIRHTMEQIGCPPIDDETLGQFIGPPLYDSFIRITGLGKEQAEKAISVFRAHYTQEGIFNATIYPGIPNLLRQLKEEGTYIAIASAKATVSVRRLLDRFGLSRFFDVIIGAEDMHREASKEGILREALPARYQRAAMVGDRMFDMEAAKKIGIAAIGAGWGYGSAEELTLAGADFVAANVSDAARILLGADALPPKGFFISIEGLDGSGKTTQMNAVAEHIRSNGYDVLMTREPGGTPISEEIRSLVLDPDRTMSAQTEALLYAAARAEHVRDKIQPALSRGKVVLCDRFIDSSIAYQGAGRGLGMDQVTAINAFAIGGTMPDLTLLFVVEAQTAFLRRSSATKLDRLERAGEAFFQRVYDAYAKIAGAAEGRVRCIDAQRPIAQVTADACSLIDRLLTSR